MLYTGQLWYSLYKVKKRSCILKSNGTEDSLALYQKLCQKSNELKKDISQLQAWNGSLEYYKHLEILAEKMPSQARLTLIDFNDKDIILEGQTHELEDILGCVYALNATKLFEELHLTELQPSSISCDEHTEKKLVNFVIKGKLKRV